MRDAPTLWLACLCGTWLSLGSAHADYEDPASDDDVIGSEGDPWAPRDEGVHRHDGLLLRVSVGAGYQRLSERTTRMLAAVDDAGSDLRHEDLTVSSAAILFAVDLGWALSDSFTLHGRLSQTSMPEPTVRGRAPGSATGRAEPTRAAAFVGPALTYFLMPLNLHATVAAGLLGLRRPRYDGDTGLGDLGFGVDLDLGKEFWVGEQWGLGAVARYTWLTAAADDAGGDRKADGYALGLGLSVSHQ